MNHPIFRTAIFGVLLTVISISPVVLRAEDQAAPVAQAQFAKELIGTWVLVGQPGKIVKPPATGGRRKICTANRWMNAQVDPKTDMTIDHKGGTYTLTDDLYEETVEYDNDNPANFIKQSFKFTIKIEDDTLTLIGIGNPWKEVLKRVK